MTFTEAAIEVLRREGKPLHFKKIAEIAVRDALLDHVGKVPDDTMADQLAAHCRLPRLERKVIAVQSGTFALVEWGLDEDPAGFENLVEAPPEAEPSYRNRERHPIPSREIARGTGRVESTRPRRREEHEERRRRFPPPAEVAYEILAGAGRPLGLREIADQGAERSLMPEAFVRDATALSAALAEDNHRREAAGRKALFQLDGDSVTLAAQPEPGERPAIVPSRPVPVPIVGVAAPADLRRSALAALRRRLRECDGPTVEHVAERMLEKLGFRELKVAKRGREHVIYTGRRRMGLADVRHGIRIARTGAEVGRRDVTELRRDLGHYGAQIGIVLSAGEAGRDARGDAAAAGQLPVLLLCGEAFAEALADSGVGCVPVVVPEVDEAFFRTAAETAEKEEAARRARREERDRREGREPREAREPRDEREEREPREPREEREPRQQREPREPREEREARQQREPREPREERERREPREPRAPRAERPPRGGARDGEPEESVSPEVALSSDDEASPEPVLRTTVVRATVIEVDATLPASARDEEDDEGGEGEEDDEDDGTAEPVAAQAGAEGGEAGASGERRRRRRRRRRRGGRGRGREGAGPGAPGSSAAPAGAAPMGGAASDESAPPAPDAAATGGAPEPPALAEGAGAPQSEQRVPAAEQGAPAAEPPASGDDGTPGA